VIDARLRKSAPDGALGSFEAPVMGMEHTVRFSGQGVPRIHRILAVLAEHNFPVQVRMVDGELTLPGEVPPDSWGDVRLGTGAGMVTLIRRGQELSVVTWGNADKAMQSAWNAVAWAAAEAGQGKILRAEGLQGASEFRTSVLMPEFMRQ
jgi:hypothetical protein